VIQVTLRHSGGTFGHEATKVKEDDGGLRVAKATLCRKAVAAVPACEQKIGQMRF
jgi:hypothetical protein